MASSSDAPTIKIKITTTGLQDACEAANALGDALRAIDITTEIEEEDAGQAASKIENFDAKAVALRCLVAQAVDQERDPSPVRHVWGPDFDGFHRDSALDGLADVLKTTDALFVLDALLNGDGS